MAQQYPEPVVGALIANPEGKVLLVKSYKWPDQYVIPGGHIKLGEAMEEALKREMKEETGLDIYDIEHAWVGESVFQDSFHSKKHFIFIVTTQAIRPSSLPRSKKGEMGVWRAASPLS
ncbi:MAG: NUDIX domain-containing protein, partial [Anaerolineae bacterium]|nr:NUDIX domain-containing protein [Anaerolineae bacterium]